MKKSFGKLLPLLIMVLLFSTFFSPITKANELSTKEDAINNSTYYSIKTHEIVLNEKQALDLNPNIEQAELDMVKQAIEKLSDAEIDTLLINNGYDLDEIKIDTDFGHANIAWFVPIIIGIILVVGAIFFSTLYFSHEEKMSLINQCYANNGYPVIDSRDEAGVNGTTDSGSANQAGGYKFECKQR
ncbi:hypothetical protein JFL43_20715 [Viridibacillus sp. YIM B01967]|uniref:Uncharacterized protein n=1 Tax=Viridibacillus soli TaxID=2798301 RepID=A0ABS1HD75_9BACL|nr:hypothetical protein [Viridibacillus soli]MBK3497204.1 hypothetical protein [Viridibacillus soli]